MIADDIKKYEVLPRLYHSEINARVQWQWDAGYDTCLLQGYDNEQVLWEMKRYTDDYLVAMNNLAEAACLHYPKSEFAHWWRQS